MIICTNQRSNFDLKFQTSYEQEHTVETGADPSLGVRGASAADLEELNALLEAQKTANTELRVRLEELQSSSSSATSHRVQELEAKLAASEEAYTSAKAGNFSTYSSFLSVILTQYAM